MFTYLLTYLHVGHGNIYDMIGGTKHLQVYIYIYGCRCVFVSGFRRCIYQCAGIYIEHNMTISDSLVSVSKKKKKKKVIYYIPTNQQAIINGSLSIMTYIWRYIYTISLFIQSATLLSQSQKNSVDVSGIYQSSHIVDTSIKQRCPKIRHVYDDFLEKKKKTALSDWLNEW